MKVIITFLFLIFSYNILCAQSSADELLAKGKDCQMVMSIKSQKEAITYYQQAKACFDSNSKKAECDNYIELCKKNIYSLSKKTQDHNEEIENLLVDHAKDSIENERLKKELEDINNRDTLSLSSTTVVFESFKEDSAIVQIQTNYSNWVYQDIPDWISISKNTDLSTITIVVRQNNGKDQRSHPITILAGQAKETVTVVQPGSDIFKKTGSFFNGIIQGKKKK